MRLFGRQAECASLDALVAGTSPTGTRGGRSASLVLRGEAGVGKTTLLRYAESRAPAALWVSGVESEADFPFAALHRLLVPLLPERDRLPATQRAALEVACGLADGPPADLFLVSLATLTLVAAAPRLCVVDDAQWLDRESLRALAFVARRLHAEGLVLLFGVRPAGLRPTGLRPSSVRPAGDDPDLLAGLPVLEVTGLAHPAAVALLTDVVDTAIDPGLAGHIARSTGGNPLALTDLGRELTAAQLSGSTPLTEPVPIGSRLEAHYCAQIAAYPPATQTWLLLVAANAGGTGAQVAAAGRLLGADPADAGPAEADRLITGSPATKFRHPLVRSAVYAGATPGQRRAAHRALASVTTGVAEADGRAWHLAAASAGPDEEVAGELERRADRAGARGGHVARATFLARAAELSPEPARRAARQVAAAAAALQAGAPARALRVLDEVDEKALDRSARGAALLTRAGAAVTTGAPGALAEAPAICLAAAEAFGEAEKDQARSAVLRAVEHAIGAEDLAARMATDALPAAAARFAGNRPAAVPELLLDGYAAFTTGGFEQGAPAMRRAIGALTGPDSTDLELLNRIGIGVTYCTLLWDDRSQHEFLRRAEDAARRTGALHGLDLVHFMAAMSAAVHGRLAEADRHDAAGQRLRRAIGITADQELVWRHPELVVWRAAAGTRKTLLDALPVFEMLGVGAMRSITRFSVALLDLANADYAPARDELCAMVELGRPGWYARVLPDLVEAAMRTGDRQTARRAYADLAVATAASGTPWALGLRARSRALLSAPDEAAGHFRLAIEHLTQTRAFGDLARAHLLHGEWLRRQRRKRDARAALGTALEMFDSVQAHAFAGRARSELQALGGLPTDRNAGISGTTLTPQEAAVARLARDGGTNAEIAAHLYLSASTVDYHLRKVYRKLDVRSRRQLRGAVHD